MVFTIILLFVIFSIESTPGNNIKISATRHSVRSFENIAEIYRSFQLLMHYFNGFLNALIMPGQKALVLFLTVVGLYGTIRFYQTLVFIAYIAFPSLALACIIYANLTYPHGRILNADSEAFRRSWRRLGMSSVVSVKDEINLDPIHLIKFLKSCRNLKVKMANFYYFENTTQTTFASKVIEFSSTLLLTF